MDRSGESVMNDISAVVIYSRIGPSFPSVLQKLEFAVIPRLFSGSLLAGTGK